MSDQEERALWRKAIEQAPDVVKWLEYKLRILETQKLQIPKFERSFLSVPLTLAPYATSSVQISTPREYDFQTVGFSALASKYSLSDNEFSTLRTALIQIIVGYPNHTEFLTHPLDVLLATKDLESTFIPSWIVDMTLPRATRIDFHIINPLSKTIEIRFAIHGNSIKNLEGSLE